MQLQTAIGRRERAREEGYRAVGLQAGRYAARSTASEPSPQAETNFFLRIVRADITFVKDAAGRVTHLVLNQNGRQHNAKKIK